MQVTTPAAARPQACSQAVNLNLGSIGRIHSHQVGSDLPERSPSWDEFAVISHAHAGLPRPGLDIDCTVLTAHDVPNLVILAAMRHNVAYYVIANAAERSARAALVGALERHRLQIILLADGGKPMWSSFYFEDTVLERLRSELQARKDAWKSADDSWRDRLGKLVLDLPEMFARAHSPAGHCNQHAAILASGNAGQFSRHLDRCMEARLRYAVQ